METVVVCAVPDVLDAAVRQENVVLALRDPVVLLVLHVAKVVARVEVPHAVPESVAGLLVTALRVWIEDEKKETTQITH